MGGLHYILGVMKSIRQKIGKYYGNEAELILEEDTLPREIQVPPDLKEAMKGKLEAVNFFENLSYTHQKSMFSGLGQPSVMIRSRNA